MSEGESPLLLPSTIIVNGGPGYYEPAKGELRLSIY